MKSKPRKQTYTLEMFLKNMNEQDIRSDQDVQRLSDQWSNNMMNELIVTILNGDYIPPVILAAELNSQMWIVDGLQRSTVLMKFRYGNYKITSAVEEPMINYRAKARNAENEILLDGNGDIFWENKQFDIRHKTYTQLPEELKKVFNEYQIETVVHEDYDMKEISKLVRRYNFHKLMNVSQRSFTFVDNYARKIREILRKPFFVEAEYTKNERKNGTLERVVMESIMCMFHLDNWKKSGQLGEYINEYSTMSEFDTLESLIIRLENVVTEQHYSIFNSRDSFILFTLFHKFTQLGYEDKKFADFLTYFKELADSTDINTLYGIEKGAGTKDKSVVIKKLNSLESLMYKFFDIVKIELSDKLSDIMEFVQQNVNSLAAVEDVEQYAEVLQALARNIGQSKLWEDNNIQSLIAIVAYSFDHDIDLDEWLLDYCNRNDSYIDNQTKNFEHMREDLEKFIQSENVA